MQPIQPASVTRRAKIAGGVVLALVGLVAAVWFGRGVFHRPNPLLLTPAIALDALEAKSLYFNAPARPWLLRRRSDLLTIEDHDAQSERTRAFAQSVENPKLFRQLDRQYRFDALLLTGDPSQYRPLLDYLLMTKDWTLRYADHTSLVFRREAEKHWQLADLEPVRARFATAPARDRAIFLAQTATKLVAAHEAEPAKQLLDEAVALDPELPDARNGLAVYDMDHSKWREALAECDRALASDGGFLPALATKTQLLYGSKHYDKAYEISRRLIQKVPDDPGLLFYHAKIAHEAHAYRSEIAALEKLIARAGAEDRPVSGYQIYLGQAYASLGDPRRSIDQFMLALNDPELSDEQRSFARENIARIKKRTGL